MTRKLTKEQRRQQLLATALTIVRSEGTDALTLGRLAEAAGVSKPIAYEHFGTRAGLLLALFRQFDDKTAKAIKDELARRPDAGLDEIIALIATAYVGCYVSAGTAFGDILDTLSATEEMAKFRASWRQELVEELLKIFQPFVRIDDKRGAAIMTGLLGAAEALSDAAATGRISDDRAGDALVHIMRETLDSFVA